MGAQIHLRPEELAGLAAELTALAAELADDAEDCRASAAVLTRTLAGPEGWRAGGVATACASLLGSLADDAAALAGTLTASLASYRGLDASLAGGIGVTGLPGHPPR